MRTEPGPGSAHRRRACLLATALLLAAGTAAAVPARAAAANSQVSYARNPDGTWTYTISNGPAGGRDSGLLFPLAYLEIQVGDTISWTNQDPAQACTVTFPDANGTYPDPASALAPTGGSTYDGAAMASSGLLAPAGRPGPHAYRLTFTTQAVFQFRNLLDSDPNRVGVISVLAMYWAGAPTPGRGLPRSGPALVDLGGHVLGGV